MQTFQGYLTIAEAAKELGVTRQRMHKIIEFHRAKTESLNPRLSLLPVRELDRIKRERENR